MTQSKARFSERVGDAGEQNSVGTIGMWRPEEYKSRLYNNLAFWRPLVENLKTNIMGFPGVGKIAFTHATMSYGVRVAKLLAPAPRARVPGSSIPVPDLRVASPRRSAAV